MAVLGASPRAIDVLIEIRNSPQWRADARHSSRLIHASRT
jgi:hypothetical protein